jgi:hypothetical protein
MDRILAKLDVLKDIKLKALYIEPRRSHFLKDPVL